VLATSTDSGGECGVIYDKRMGLGMPIIKGPPASLTCSLTQNLRHIYVRLADGTAVPQVKVVDLCSDWFASDFL
jgi:hypothetical protein